MRVALLSLLEPAAADPGMARGYLRIGGQSLARHQLSLVLALGCGRVIFLAEALSGELVALQHVAEAAGVLFHVVSSPRALPGIVAPSDELVVLGDGLLAMPEDALELLGAGDGVLVVPVEAGLAAGFERIDINHAEAGAMRLPGRIVAGLGDLPGDWSAPSALIRLALQAGVRQVPLPPALIEGGRWALVRSEDEAHALEPRWLRLHTASVQRRTPGSVLATVLVHQLGPAILHAGTRPLIVVIAAWVVALLGFGAAWLGGETAGFALFGLAWLVRVAASLLDRIERDSLRAPGTWVRIQMAFSWGLDLLFVLAATWRSALAAATAAPAGSSAFAPLVLFALLRFLPKALPRSGWAGWLEDRLLIGAALAVASATDGFDAALMVGALALLVAAMVFPGGEAEHAPNPPLTKQG